MKVRINEGELLSVSRLLRDLESDGLLDSQQVTQALRQIAGAAQDHPLVQVANLQLHNRQRADRPLEMPHLLEWLAGRLGLRSWSIDPLKVDVPAVTAVMSHEFALRHGILAVSVDAECVVVATAEPGVQGWVDNIAHVSRRRVERVLADPRQIERYTQEFYSMARSVRGATRLTDGVSQASSFEQLLDLQGNKEQDPDANDQHIVNVVDWLLQYAFEQRASDIHIEPRREISRIRFRIDGMLQTVYELPEQVGRAVLSRLKILGRMNLAEKRKPQDGRLKTRSPEGSEVELRLATMPTAFGEKLVMRIFDPDLLLKSFAELGLEDEDYRHWQSMISRPHGIVLVTGPTGSGKTTTLYSTLRQLARPEVNVCTIEDPIEMIEPAFNQMQVQHGIGLDFASGVRALMRQDPDIIMIGEIRDLETAEHAVQAALTGHLVLSSLHTNDAPSAITRLLELGVPAYLLRATLIGVMAQRLVRTLCPHCKTPCETDPQAWQALTHPWKATLPTRSFQAQGCTHCRHTGYLGRQGIYELLQLDDRLRSELTDQLELDSLRRQSMRQGLRTLRLSGAQRIARGQTTIDEVLRVAPPSISQS